METADYNDMSDNELKDILAGDLKFGYTPDELREVAEDIRDVEQVDRKIIIGFIKFCDDFEQWCEATSKTKQVETFIRDNYNMQELGIDS